MEDVVIPGIVGLVTSTVSSFVTWVLARKKYNSEVDNNLIENMQKSLEFYKQLSDDNKARLDEVLKRNDQLEDEINDLRKTIMSLMTSMCVDMTCQMRKRDLTLYNK